MSGEHTETNQRLRKDFISLQDHYLSSIMNAKTMNNYPAPFRRPRHNQSFEAKKFENRQSLSQGQSRRSFSVESLILLICLTASLLILPLILPPLPPPPFMLLLLPIGILTVLMIFAFRPITSNARDITYTYM